MPERREPEAVVSSVDEALEEAVRLFDARRFFEAHEFLEWIWKSPEVPPGDRDFWKGVTQVAVGCVHIQRGNRSGALKLLDRAAGHLRRQPQHDRGVDRANLRAVALWLAGQVERHGPTPELDFPRFPRREGAAWTSRQD